MEPDKQLLEAWENAAALGSAWLVFGYAKNKKRFFELRREGKHHGLQSHMEHELIWRICDGDFQAFGIQHGSDAGPIPIPKYYFSKTVVVDWNRETIEAFGKKFYEVRIQGQQEQEPPDEMQPTEPQSGPYVFDPRELSAQRKREREQGRLDDTLRSVPTTSREPHETTDQGERDPRHETLPSEPTRASEPEESAVPIGPESAPELLSTETSPRRGPGRPDKSAEIDQAINLLLGRPVDLAAMPRQQAFRAVRKCAASELKSNINIGFSDPVLQRALFRRFGRRR